MILFFSVYHHKFLCQIEKAPRFRSLVGPRYIASRHGGTTTFCILHSALLLPSAFGLNYSLRHVVGHFGVVGKFHGIGAAALGH